MAQKTVLAVKQEARTWQGNNGPMKDIEVIFDDASSGSISCPQEKEAEVRAALAGLIGAPGEFELNPTEYGTKIKNYPGKPQGVGGKGGNRGPGDWESHDERAHKDAAITAMCAARLALEAATACGVTDEKVLLASIQEHTVIIARAIRAAAVVVNAEGGYPAKAAPSPAAPAAGSDNGKSAGGTERISQVIEVGGGDPLSVPRARRLLLERLNVNDFDMVTDEEWRDFLTALALAGTS